MVEQEIMICADAFPLSGLKRAIRCLSAAAIAGGNRYRLAGAEHFRRVRLRFVPLHGVELPGNGTERIRLGSCRLCRQLCPFPSRHFRRRGIGHQNRLP